MLITPKGNLEWTRAALAVPKTLVGVTLDGDPQVIAWRRRGDAVQLTAYDGSTVTQAALTGPDAPMGRAPFVADVRLRLVSEDDYAALEAAIAAGEPVRWWAGWWIIDVWDVTLGGPGRTTWRTSRRLPTAAVDPASTLDPVAALDGVALTPVDADPAAGEVVIPSTNNGPEANNAEIQTAALDGAQRLTLRYAAEHWVIPAELRLTSDEPNRLEAELELTEHLPARFSWF